MTVGPTLRYRLFALPAIARALCLYVAERVSSREVRPQISPWRKIGAAAHRSWQTTLRQWLRAAASGRLFPFTLAERCQSWQSGPAAR